MNKKNTCGCGRGDCAVCRRPFTIDEVMALLREELERAEGLHKPFNSEHEGYSVILEELDELWDEVKLKQSLRDPSKMLKECVQVAAMGCRFALNLCRTGKARRAA
jgi:hypothetical protein